MAHVGSKIKKLREMRNFTQQHMAKKLGLTQSSYSKIESGETKIDIPKLQKLAEVLSVEVSELLDKGDNQVNNFSNNKINNATIRTGMPLAPSYTWTAWPQRSSCRGALDVADTRSASTALSTAARR